MAGMFYSLLETAQKLNKTENQIKEMVKSGALREFRDGANLLFKIDEVDALLTQQANADLEDIILAEDTEPTSDKSKPAEKAADKDSKPGKKPQDSIFLEEDTGSKADLISSDTALIGDGIVLEKTGSGIRKDDLLDETASAASKAGGKKETGDMSLDTFGSGGLLDLSLQADDTSLGGILDEIYTSDAEAPQAGAASPAAMEAEIKADEMLADLPQPTAGAAAVMPVHIEAPPDRMSIPMNVLLAISLLVVIFTAIIAATGFNNIMPSILKAMQTGSSPNNIHMIWYIVGATSIVSLLIFGAALLLGGPKTASAAVKPKKEKPPKPAKQKKTK
jgi:hypothetical protein